MKCNERGGIGGLIIIFVGVVWLLVNTGVVDRQIIGYLFQFWPLLLILGGVSIILGQSLPARVFLTLLTLAALVWVLASGMKFFGGEYYRRWGFDRLPGQDIKMNYYFRNRGF